MSRKRKEEQKMLQISQEINHIADKEVYCADEDDWIPDKIHSIQQKIHSLGTKSKNGIPLYTRRERLKSALYLRLKKRKTFFWKKT